MDTLSSVTQAEDRVSGIVTALVDSGAGDIYNRLLCPTCIVQIIIINTMIVRKFFIFVYHSLKPIYFSSLEN